MNSIGRVLLLLLFSVSFHVGNAQIAEEIFSENSLMPEEKKGELYFKADNLSFFRNNEYAANVVKGYSLPGFWLRPAVGYYMLDNVRLELGAHLLRYWGTDSYPCFAYDDISEWKGNDYQRGFHALPWFRAQVKFSDKFQLILGNIYGGTNHKLIEPLYNSELAMTTDPEAGLQLLYNSSRFSLDLWLNWESYIFRNDYHQEAFMLGISSRFNVNTPENKHHVYIPLQAVAQHRGGEIDTLYTESVQTLMNAATGVGVDFNMNNRFLKKISTQVNVAAYYQQAGSLWPTDNGWATGGRVDFYFEKLHFKTSYWHSQDFITMLGSPFYGSASLSDIGTVFQNPHLIAIGATYSHRFNENVAIGADADVYQYFYSGNSSTSFSLGVYLRLTPSFLIKKW